MRLTAVVPAYNESEGLEAFLLALAKQLEAAEDYEILVVDDGSADGTWAAIRRSSERNQAVRGIRFTRNFGKENAILAGLRASRGDAVLVLDADGQHPLELIPRMLEARAETGAPIVEAVKAMRQSEGTWRRIASRSFYRIFRATTGLALAGATDFKLLDRPVVETYLALPERKRFFRALTRWMGYASVEIPFVPPDRQHGQSRWPARRLLSLGWSSLKAFTIAPLRLVAALGLLTLAATGVLAAHTLYRWWTGAAAPGFATVILLQLGIGSVLMISLGLLGEYLGQVYEEVKGRPPYVIRDWIGAVDAQGAPQKERP